MDQYEQSLINKINELNNATTALQRTRRMVLLQILGQYQNEKKSQLR